MKVEESIHFYDGLITEKKLNDINKILLNKNFPWYYNHQPSENDYNFKNTFEHFQFAHWFVFNSEISSTYINDFKNVLDNVPINYDLIVRAKANFLPQVQNNSFNNPHKDIVRKDRQHKIGIIYLNDADGDTVIVKKTSNVDSGQIAVVLIDDQEATLKRVRKKGNTIALEADNRSYGTKIYAANRIKIQGKLVSLYRNFH